MKNLTILLTILMCAALVGCGANKDAEINTFVAELNKLTTDVTAKVNADPTSGGVDEAQKILDGKKADLKTKFGALENVSNYEVSEGVSKKFSESVSGNVMSINELKVNHVEKTLNDEAFGKKIDKLVNDFNGIIGL